MKDVFLMYDTCCLYEVIILNYFMSVTGCDMITCSLDGKPIRATEGYKIDVDMSLQDVRKEEIRSFIVPGGDISKIDDERLYSFLRELKEQKVLIGGICAGVNILESAGTLNGIESTLSADLDVVNDKKIITARANAYVDFAIEVAKELDLFDDEDDIKETVDFWKYHRRAQ